MPQPDDEHADGLPRDDTHHRVAVAGADLWGGPCDGMRTVINVPPPGEVIMRVPMQDGNFSRARYRCIAFGSMQPMSVMVQPTEDPRRMPPDRMLRLLEGRRGARYRFVEMMRDL